MPSSYIWCSQARPYTSSCSKIYISPTFLKKNYLEKTIYRKNIFFSPKKQHNFTFGEKKMKSRVHILVKIHVKSLPKKNHNMGEKKTFLGLRKTITKKILVCKKTPNVPMNHARFKRLLLTPINFNSMKENFNTKMFQNYPKNSFFWN